MQFSAVASRQPFSRLRMRICCALFAVSAASAQSSVSGPSLGLVFDPVDQAIRPILGIPGASTAGAHFDAGYPLTSAIIGPAHDFAIGISAADGSLNLVSFTSTGISSQPLSTSATPDRIILSPSGSSALLYFKSSMTVQLIAGLPGSPKPGTQLDISMLPQAPDTFAISDDGSIVLAGVIENTSDQAPSGEIFVIPADGSATRAIARVQHASAISFFNQSHDVLIADDAANSVILISDAAGQSNPTWSFSDPGLMTPDSVRVSGDGKTALAGSSKNQVLAIIDLTGANGPTFLSCQCAPAEMRPLRQAAVYQITEPQNGLFWILDSSAQKPRLLFVPVPNDGDGSGTGSAQ